MSPQASTDRYGDSFMDGRVYTIREVENKVIKELQISVDKNVEYRKGLLAALQIIRGDKK